MQLSRSAHEDLDTRFSSSFDVIAQPRTRRHSPSVNSLLSTIGKLPIRAVTAAHLLAVMQKVEAKGAPTIAVMIRQWAYRVFNHAIANLKADANPAAGEIRDAIHARTLHYSAPTCRHSMRPWRLWWGAHDSDRLALADADRCAFGRASRRRVDGVRLRPRRVAGSRGAYEDGRSSYRPIVAARPSHCCVSCTSSPAGSASCSRMRGAQGRTWERRHLTLPWCALATSAGFLHMDSALRRARCSTSSGSARIGLSAS